MRLIDADKLKDTWLHSADHTGRFVDFIDNAPTIDSEPVVHGHWEECSNELNKKCSNCGKVIGDIYSKPKYCEYCGAKMAEEQE